MSHEGSSTSSTGHEIPETAPLGGGSDSTRALVFPGVVANFVLSRKPASQVANIVSVLLCQGLVGVFLTFWD